MPEPHVVIRFHVNGEITYHVTEGVRVFMVDERMPHDRVYEWTSIDPHEIIKDILRQDIVGHRGDPRHAAAERRIISAQLGRPHLHIVRDVEEPDGWGELQ